MTELFMKNVREPFNLAPDYEVSGEFRPLMLAQFLDALGGDELERFEQAAAAKAAAQIDPGELTWLLERMREVILATQLTWNLRDPADPASGPVEVSRENLLWVDEGLLMALGSHILEVSNERLGNSPVPSPSSSAGRASETADHAEPSTPASTG